ncbi:MAG: nucleotide sugar-1-phosphate transferase [Myxococcales bacterium]
MEAVILAAGVARRLRPYMDDQPKCLLMFDGRSLLERHLTLLRELGVERVTIVTGHLAELIEGPFRDFPGLAVRFVRNERYTEGSILSMRVGLDGIDRDALLMDADVLYEREVLARLVAARGSCFLLDETADETGEEMMLGARDGLVRTIARRVGDGWDERGEGVGFFRVAGEQIPALLQATDALLAEGHSRVEYEAAIDVFLKDHPAGYVKVGDLAWTEIDFPEDVQKAEVHILPVIRGQER